MASIQRRKTVAALIGGVRVGSDAPVVVQSMTNTDTADVASTAQQVAALARAGSELVRVTVNNEEAAAGVAPIVDELEKRGIRVPIIGDFHYNGHILLKKYPECARALDKYRINPGNVSVGRKDDSNFRTMIEVAVENQKPVRIGVNWGSLDQSLLTRMMDENSRRAADSAVPRNPQLQPAGHCLSRLRTHHQHLLPGNGRADSVLSSRADAGVEGTLLRRGRDESCRHGMCGQRPRRVEAREFGNFSAGNI